MRIFKNPVNGHQEVVDGGASFGVFFFGALYLAVKGLWGHVFVWLLLVAVPAIASGGILVIVSLPIAAIIYALSIQSILRNRYLRTGWEEVGTEYPTAPVSDETWYRKCPFCAEEILAAAIKCKHCHSDIEPLKVADNKAQ